MLAVDFSLVMKICLCFSAGEHGEPVQRAPEGLRPL